MTSATPAPRQFINWRRLLLTRLVVIVAALVVTLAALRVWPASFPPNHVYAVADLIISCIAIPRLRRGGWVLVGVHLLISLIWCEVAWNLPQRWFQ